MRAIVIVWMCVVQFGTHGIEFPDTDVGRAGKVAFEKEIAALWDAHTIEEDEDPTITLTTFGDETYKAKGTVLRLKLGYPEVIYSFRGIKYAEHERFQIPVAAGAYWDSGLILNDLNAKRLGPSCVQSPSEYFFQDEDCLYLNVFMPALPDADSDPLPVMVFIHGGSFTSGSSSIYLPNKLVEHDVILVTINYRLGALGFFTTDDNEAPGNYALYDQREALRWVRDHISDFGGDVSRITVFGESAGAASVSYMVIVADEDSFHAAISESGSTSDPWAFDLDHEYATEYMSTNLGCYNKIRQEVNMTCMTLQDATDIVNVSRSMVGYDRSIGLPGFRGVSPFVQAINVDNPILIKEPELYYVDKDVRKVHYMLGSNKNEGSFVFSLVHDFYLIPNDLVNNTAYLREELINDGLECFGIYDDSYGLANTMQLEYCYDVDLANFSESAPCLVDMLGVMFLKAGGWKVANLHSEYTRKNTYYYSFDYSEGPSLSFFYYIGHQPEIDPGVTHGDDLIYLFIMPVPMGDDDKIIESRMTLLWTNFAKYGNPTPEEDSKAWNDLDIPFWTPYGFGDHHYLLMRNNFIMQQEFPLRWTIMMDEIRAGGDQITKEPTVTPTTTVAAKEPVNIIEDSRRIRSYRDLDDDEAIAREVPSPRYTQNDIDDIEDEREAYMITMIIFIILFCISTGVAIFFFIKMRNKN